jgi:phage protein D
MSRARQCTVQIAFDGVDISDDVSQDLISMRYIDSEEDEADDLQLTLHDRSSRWLDAWLDDTLIAQLNTDASGKPTKGLEIKASIICENWASPGNTLKLDCGSFALDDINASGPPNAITIKASSLPDKNGIRTTMRSKSWENYRLAGVGKEIASRAGLGFIFDSGYDPTFPHKEQNEQTDIAFLKRLCNESGCSLKISHGKIIIFDQSKYEKLPHVAVIGKGDGSYTRYDLRSSQSDVNYTHCVVRYLPPSGGSVIEGIAYNEKYKPDGDNIGLTITGHKVTSAAAAKALAEKLLRLKNKFEKKGRFTMVGNPSLVASEALQLEGWGAFNGRYIIKRTTHDISASGYKTDVEIRNVL